MAELSSTEPQYKIGDRIEYRPVGGGADNVSHSQGEIVSINGAGAELKYVIKNANTGKKTTYRPKNIVKKLDS